MKLHRTLQSLVTRHSSLVTALAFALVSAPAGAETVQIASAADWDAFAARVNAGETSLDARMTADVLLSQDSPRAGDTEAHAWRGTFDGDGHTLVVRWSFSDGTANAAPFAYAARCTIKNLRVTGSIQSNGKYAAGFIGTNNRGDADTDRTVITNCRSSVAITCGIAGEAASGGFVGQLEPSGQSRLEFRDCLFDGSLLGASANSCGGFVGYRPFTAYVHCFNSLFAPEAVTISTNACRTISRNGWDDNDKVYYTRTLGEAQGTDASAMSAAALAAALGDAWEASGGKVGLKALPDLTPIASAADWTAFAGRVNAGETDLCATLTADVWLDNGVPSVGTADHPWSGTFDGAGHTLCLDWDRNANYVAPFRYTSGCTIENLHVTGTIKTSGFRAGGFIGQPRPGTTTIRCCRSSVTIDSSFEGSASHGGFVGYTYWSPFDLHFIDCLFDGSLLGPASTDCGGFVGFNSSDPYLYFENCLFAPQQITLSSTGSGTFANSYQYFSVSYSNARYTIVFGREQGSDASGMHSDELAAALGPNWTNANGRAALVLFPDPPGDPEPAVLGFVYQGALRDAQGHELGEGTRTVEFRLYDTATGGSPLWGRAHGVRLDAGGLFLAELSDESGDALPNVVSNGLAGILGANAGGTLYLGLAVSGDAAEIAPRQRILAAPFALRAADLYGASGDLAVAGRASAAGAAVAGELSVSDVRVAGALATVSLATSADAEAAGSLAVGGAISGYGTFPVGAIVLWSGAENAIPDGWALCNGATVNGVRTPDLRNRFVPGAGDKYGVGATGGEDKHQLSVSEIPSHSHSYQFKGADLDLAWDGDNYFYDASGHYSGNGNTKWTDSTGGAAAHENRPPYYALCFIIRVR